MASRLGFYRLTLNPARKVTLMDGPDLREELAESIRDRRLLLGLSVRAAANEAGIDRETWTNAEAAKRQLSRRHWAGVERALRWAPGSISRILAGAEPEEMAEPNVGPDAVLADEIERISELRGITPGDRMRMIRALVKVYQEQSEAHA